jgi:DNA (cytosine-5)-methyltransferase 1
LIIADYPSFLISAWGDHVAAREADAPTVVSLFAGCGGSSLGYSMAGYRELLAVDWDAACGVTFRANFPGVPFVTANLREIAASDLMDLAGVGVGELDVLDGSPPCQGFSSAGKRRMEDVRNELPFEFARLLAGLRPRTFVMENVPGLVKGKMKWVFAEITAALRESGYDVRCQKLNASYFGVPQSRERLIWVGVRDDLNAKPEFPVAETRPVTVREAWGGADELPGPSREIKFESVLKMMRLIGSGDTIASVHPKKSYFNWRRHRYDRPAYTLTATVFAGEGLHPVANRAVTVPEAKRLGSYPDEFVFPHDVSDTMAQIGNSVPPLMMKAVASRVRSTLAHVESDESRAGERTFFDVGFPKTQREPAHEP